METRTLITNPCIDAYRSEGTTQARHRNGCLVCGAELVYLERPATFDCHYCGRSLSTQARCTHGHFVCDACHGADAVAAIAQICAHSAERDAVALMQAVRSHPRFAVHGPEHHAMVPAVILAALRNGGLEAGPEKLATALQRGQSIQGGACAFLGVCGAAAGVGIAVSLLTEATPYDGQRRQLAQRATSRALERIASFEAPRCCQRDAWLALQEASGFLKEHLDLDLPVAHPLPCRQMDVNKECIGERCPLWGRGEA